MQSKVYYLYLQIDWIIR